jgi:hypothetical protein
VYCGGELSGNLFGVLVRKLGRATINLHGDDEAGAAMQQICWLGVCAACCQLFTSRLLATTLMVMIVVYSRIQIILGSIPEGLSWPCGNDSRFGIGYSLAKEIGSSKLERFSDGLGVCRQSLAV